MEQSVHIASKFVVEYGIHTDFKGNNKGFKKVLDALGAQDCEYIGNDGEYSNNIDVSLKEYNVVLKNLRKLVKDPKAKLIIMCVSFDDEIETETLDTHYIMECINDLGMTPQQLLSSLEAFYKEGARGDGVLHFSFF